MLRIRGLTGAVISRLPYVTGFQISICCQSHFKKKEKGFFLTYVQDYTIIMTLHNAVVYSNKHNLQTILT